MTLETLASIGDGIGPEMLDCGCAASKTCARSTDRAFPVRSVVTVYINNYFNAATQSPVGGFKPSGYGRENGFEGMRCFMQTKSVWVATNPDQPDPFPE